MVSQGRVRVAVQVVSFRPKRPSKGTIFRFADTKMAHRTLAVGDYKESKPYKISVNAHRSQVGCDVRSTIGGVISTSCVNHVVKAGESGVSLVSVKLPEPNTISPTDFLRYVFYMMTTTIAVVRDSSPEVYYPNNVFHDEDSIEDRSTSFFRKDVGLFLGIRRPVNSVNPDDRFKVDSVTGWSTGCHEGRWSGGG